MNRNRMLADLSDIYKRFHCLPPETCVLLGQIESLKPNSASSEEKLSSILRTNKKLESGSNLEVFWRCMMRSKSCLARECTICKKNALLSVLSPFKVTTKSIVLKTEMRIILKTWWYCSQIDSGMRPPSKCYSLTSWQWQLFIWCQRSGCTWKIIHLKKITDRIQNIAFHSISETKRFWYCVFLNHRYFPESQNVFSLTISQVRKRIYMPMFSALQHFTFYTRP